MRYDQLIILQKYVGLNIGKAIVERIIKRVFVAIIIVGETIDKRGRL
jgi:hypothetical protein